IVIITIPLLYACKEIKVTYSDSGSTIDMVAGQILKIELPANASSGNTWRKIVYDDSVIVKAGKPNYMLSDDRLGSPGVYYYRFKTVGPGTSKLTMEYGSKYDDDKKAVKVFEITIIVHEK
ncbi:MAG: protease inhibitor I42 family protein, partial [Bacteroidetes bacterium]|nr:protease inhibitor I42 family protein [Bacteroidota bacterium]